MWLGSLAEAVKGGFDWGPLAAFGAAVIALLGAVFAALVSLRTSRVSEDSKREADLEQRVDAELARVTGERDRLRVDYDRLRNEYEVLWTARQQVLEREVAYRRYIREQGENPDEVLTGG